VVNGEMSLRRLKLSRYEVVTPRGGGGEEEEALPNLFISRRNASDVAKTLKSEKKTHQIYQWT
jgi:hypothetical protein